MKRVIINGIICIDFLLVISSYFAKEKSTIMTVTDYKSFIKRQSDLAKVISRSVATVLLLEECQTNESGMGQFFTQ